ncbi:class II fructose-bisphosphate aldolase [Pseudovibrio exalbescens]|uniref:Fructose-bisphosphate aldolase n=1 Tax=Pseudovibrio exalbescens TaxID=197461 RepID=A0A1U7JLR8_9HYPH|nr:class II fructose-bisphosphate aldolase [Pseudovibrio exalbescens]OKL45669.1 class II fructose-bisphosphate aldolase [Pseudovibrio exalbescens]
MGKLQPGVVYGDDYKKLVDACREEGYALPAVNIVGTNSLNAVLEAAAKNKSDVIIQLSNGGAQFFAGQGMEDDFKARVLGAVSAAQHVHLLAKHYGVCVVLHTDHANRKFLPWLEALVDEGEAYYKQHGKPLFTSHMLDLSEESLEENLAESERLLKRMAPLEMSLEIELGCTGGEEDGVGSDEDIGADNPKLYTQPEDVLQAYDRLSPLGHFSVAASFGNVHGVYKPGNVKLRPEILRESQKLVQETHSLEKNPLPLVFHGGSGSEKAKITESLGYGVFKMNIDTDTQFAFSKPIGEYVEANPKAFKYQVDPEDGSPYKKLYDPRKVLRAGELGIVERLTEAFKDLGSTGKSLA